MRTSISELSATLRKSHPQYLLSVGVLLVAFSPLLPNHYPPWVGFHHEAAAFAGWLAIATSILCCSGSSVRVTAAIPTMLGIAAIGWLQLAAGKVHFAGDALVFSLYLVSAALLYEAGSRVAQSAIGSSNVIAVLSFSLLFSCGTSFLLATVQWLRQEDLVGLFISNMPPAGRPYANLNQPNHLGTLMIMGLCAAAYLYEMSRIRALSFLVLASAFGLTTVMTESRTAMLSMILLGFYVALTRDNFDQRLKLRNSTIFFYIVAVASLWAYWPALCDVLYLAPARGGSVTSSNGRLHMWNQISLGLLNSPLTGYGVHQVSAAQIAGSTMAPSSKGESLTDYSHNILLDVLVWFGVPIGGAIVVMLITLMVKAYGIRNDRLPNFAAVCLALPIIIHSLLEYPFAYAYFLLPAAFFLGFRTTPRFAKIAQSARGLLIALTITTASILCALGWEYLELEEDYRVQRFASLRVGKIPVDFQWTDVRSLDQLAAGLEAARVVPRFGMTVDELERIQIMSQRFLFADLHESLVLAYAMNGRKAECQAALSQLGNIFGASRKARAETKLRALDGSAKPGEHLPP